jgi:hypothetical protein
MMRGRSGEGEWERDIIRIRGKQIPRSARNDKLWLCLCRGQ